MPERCSWCLGDPLYIKYHDTEWGVPVYDDRLLFEFLVLEGAQAGLSWLTILKRREHYRLLFDNFDVQKVAQYDEKKIAALLNDKRIIRNRRKIESAINNARCFLKIQKQFGSFSTYIWGFVDNTPIVNHRAPAERFSDIPSTSAQSDALSKNLKKRGFSFVGSTICYAHMQATGMVNDHFTNCFRYRQLINT